MTMPMGVRMMEEMRIQGELVRCEITAGRLIGVTGAASDSTIGG